MGSIEDVISMKGFSIQDCIDVVGKTPVEITIRISPEEQEMTISPWSPLSYACPKQVLKSGERVGEAE